VTPALAPDANELGQIYWYTLAGGGQDLGELRALQDSDVRPQLAAVPGVAEVASVGGSVREYQIAVDPERLRSLGIPLGEVVAAVGRASGAVGGEAVARGSAEFAVRGLTWAKSADDLVAIVVATRGKAPVLLRQLGHVQLGPAPRRSILEKDGAEAISAAARERGLAVETGRPLSRPFLARKTKGELTRELDAMLQMPGWTNVWTQPIAARVDMLATGIRTQVGVKVLGQDLRSVQSVADAVAAVLREVPGAADVAADQLVRRRRRLVADAGSSRRLGRRVGLSMALRVPFLGGSVGRLHRLFRARHRDWDHHAGLSARSRRAARRAGRDRQRGRIAYRGAGGSGAEAQAKATHRGSDRAEPLADALGERCRRGDPAADVGAGPGGILVADEVIDLSIPVLFYWLRKARLPCLTAPARLGDQRTAASTA
jgi:hypothetical protein